ncbi:hypothetical protein LTR37_017837 [Vermiconidia calcicola]|uniref:Uncharacterized protein n=1 Tax=Vermiconidia calcicola TaxID=1690605 RepID=A0ACC3MJR4_9PEZI|nr:hypothetical protein LTR37_017837 [Vermiconidia calcicola]
MASRNELYLATATGDLPSLRNAFLTSNSIPCTHASTCFPNNNTLPCPRTAELLANHAAEHGQLETWCYLFDNYLQSPSQSIPWDSLRHTARRGDVTFADAFQLRQPGWADSVEPQSVLNRPRSMTVVKLAVMRGHLDFLGYLVEKGYCDINAGGRELSPVRMVVGMDIEDDESMKRLKFLVRLGAHVDGTGAVEAADAVGRPAEIVHYLQARQTAEQ